MRNIVRDRLWCECGRESRVLLLRSLRTVILRPPSGEWINTTESQTDTNMVTWRRSPLKLR